MRNHYSYRDFSEPRLASIYDHTRFGDAVGHWVQELEFDIVDRRFDFKGKSVLDVGAGTGRMSIFLAERGAKVIGLDASLEMLNILRKKIINRNLNIDMKLGDAHNIPFPAKYFDYVVSFMTMMHVADWKRVLSEMCRVAKGCIILQFPSKASYACLSPLVQPMRKIFNENAQKWHAFFVDDIEKILQKDGFSVLWSRKELALPVMVHRLLNNLTFSKKIESYLCKMQITSLIGTPVLLMAARKESSSES